MQPARSPGSSDDDVHAGNGDVAAVWGRAGLDILEGGETHSVPAPTFTRNKIIKPRTAGAPTVGPYWMSI